VAVMAGRGSGLGTRSLRAESTRWVWSTRADMGANSSSGVLPRMCANEPPHV